MIVMFAKLAFSFLSRKPFHVFNILFLRGGNAAFYAAVKIFHKRLWLPPA